jgi:mannosyltransferase
VTAPAQRASGRPPRIDAAAAVATGQDPGGAGPSHLVRLAGWMPIGPAAATLAVTLYGISSPSFWRDEAATVTATKRSLPEMARMLRHVDAVHGAYYLLMWPLAHLFGTSEFAMRLPSAIAMAAAAWGTAVIGRRLGRWQTGLLAGLVFAALPMTSRFGQEARSYALVTAVAVIASYLLVRAIDKPGSRLPVAYGLSLVALGFLNMFGLLIIPAHAITLAAARRHGSLEEASRPARASSAAAPGLASGSAGGWATGTMAGWAIGAAVAFVTIIPVAFLAWHERAQLAWLRRPSFADVTALGTMLTGSGASFALIAALGAAAVADCAGSGFRRAGPASSTRPGRSAGLNVLRLSVPWLLLPPVLLIAASEIKPVYVPRYVVFCLPALALLAGAGLAALGRCWRIAALSVLALLALPMQQAIRQPWGHGDNIRAAALVVQAQAKPGDAVLYLRPGFRDFGAVYPYGFTRLRDIGLQESAVAAGNLSGTEVPRQVLERRLGVARRLWLVEVDHDEPDAGLVGWPRFRWIHAWSFDGIRLQLYLHRAERVAT